MCRGVHGVDIYTGGDIWSCCGHYEGRMGSKLHLLIIPHCLHGQVSSDSEAVELMNDSPYGLTASIWTSPQSQLIFNELASEIDTGTVFFNKYVSPLCRFYPSSCLCGLPGWELGVTLLIRLLHGPGSKTAAVASAVASLVSIIATCLFEKLSSDSVTGYDQLTRPKSVYIKA